MRSYNLTSYILLFLTILFASCTITDVFDACVITGKIVDSSGKGLADVTISIKSKGEDISLTTLANGTYKISVPTAGLVSITFNKDKYLLISKIIVLQGGEKKVIDLTMITFSENAYLKLDSKQKTVHNTGEVFAPIISTNVTYEYQSSATWITFTKIDSNLIIKCDSNEIASERNAVVILKGEYNVNDTLAIKQLAGPILRVLDYVGKKDTSFPHTKPFVTFSREITVQSVKSEGQNIGYELSSDNKRIYLNDFKVGIFSTLPIELMVKASDNIQLTFLLLLKPFINFQPIKQYSTNSSLFTKDNKFVWIYSSTTQNKVLKQYSTVDFTETKQSLNVEFHIMSYNSYNNCLYLIKHEYYQDRYINEISLYEATTGDFKSKFTIDHYGEIIQDMEFSSKGYGLMVLGEKIFYIDSAYDHTWSLFSTDPMLYDQHHGNLIPNQIDMCNNNQLFVLNGQDSSGRRHVYSVDAKTKTLSLIFTSTLYTDVVTSNFDNSVVYFSRSYYRFTYQNVETLATKMLKLPKNGVGNMAILFTDKSTSDVFTSDVALVSSEENTIHSFTQQDECYYIKSSNDGKLLIVNKNGIVYLFRSAIFTNFADYIK